MKLFKTLINKNYLVRYRYVSTSIKAPLDIAGISYDHDEFTNITSKIAQHVGKNIYKKPFHPLSNIRENIVDFFYTTFKSKTGNSVFAVFDDIRPVVSVENNFDSLLVPSDHVSRAKNDCYYVNKQYLLRSHMTAHQVELMKMGLNNFIMVGDVYRRDEIDSSHYPVFHQLDAVRLLSPQELLLFRDDGRTDLNVLQINGTRTPLTQEDYTEEATNLAVKEMKKTLESLCSEIFGKTVIFRWVDAYFPFTHPSWELEILLNDKWLEVLGCGVMEHRILQNGGCTNRIGWAFGLGLERLAMILHRIPDIRLFWSEDSGFLKQFDGKACSEPVIYKPVSVFPQCINDMSFWVPEDYQSNDFYELARDAGGDVIEQIELVDKFTKKITYRHMEKTLTKEEVNKVHESIASKASELLKVQLR